MTPEDVIHDALMDELGPILEEPPTSRECAYAATSITRALKEEYPRADLDGTRVAELEDALARISEAYPGDRDYPGLVARAALGTRR